MSAIREVRFLRELRHQNVIEVRFPSGSFPLPHLPASFLPFADPALPLPQHRTSLPYLLPPLS
jgi:hypothetical protein